MSHVERHSFAVICPVHNEEGTVRIFFGRLMAVLERLSERYRPELVFVDNDSSDSTRAVISELARNHTNVRLIALSRNVGYQCSVECGLRSIDADISAVIDVDCEDPPEMLAEMLAHFESGFDIVYGERVDRAENEMMKLGRRLFYRLTHAIADDLFILDMAEFCVMSRRVREAILADNNSFPFWRASIGRVGFSRKNIPYRREPRAAGKTHYNIWRIVVFAVAGILSSSTFLLRLPAYSFPIWVAAMCLLFLLAAASGSAATFQLMCLLGFLFCGFTLMSVALYTARIYKNGLNRPNYFVDTKRSLPPGE